eukprot:TRINITY_DN4191_c0_g1_i2.p1 TRINITY_DN4191_c0_g1~~TRINITY_DN4191_c0_g1_i2.p1  ORF type:complete len:662 (-),score=90.67 TRINITY_DN4191_c0_g1_i2:79-1995(-)
MVTVAFATNLSDHAEWRPNLIPVCQGPLVDGVCPATFPLRVYDAAAAPLRFPHLDSFRTPNANGETKGQAPCAGISHWPLHGNSGGKHGSSGSSWYTRAMNMVQQGYAMKGFQVGLGGAWLLPDAEFDKHGCPCSDRGEREWCTDGTCAARGGCADVFETMEGGLGYWTSEQPTPYVKWRLNQPNGCYARQMMSGFWDFDGSEIPCGELGFVQLSNNLLMGADGLSFEHPANGMLGQAFMKSTIGRTGPEDDAKGHHTFMLVLDADNFAGPVGYTLEEFWRDNKGDPKSPDFSYTGVKMGSTGFEINSGFAFTSSLGQEMYAKIPNFSFPVQESRTEILAGVRSWEDGPFSEPLETVLEGTAPKDIMEGSMSLGNGIKPSCDTSYRGQVALGYAGLPNMDLGGSMEFNERDGECISEIRWSDDTPCIGGNADGWCDIPVYWRKRPTSASSKNSKPIEGVTAADLPGWSTLDKDRFPERSHHDVPPLDALSTSGACKSTPGPAKEDSARLHCAQTVSGSWVSYRWYRFVDQPSLQRSGLTTAQKEYLQKRVERLHDELSFRQPLNRWMERPPTASKIGLVSLDKAFLVRPPEGMESGFVPIVLFEGMDKPDTCSPADHFVPRKPASVDSGASDSTDIVV